MNNSKYDWLSGGYPINSPEGIAQEHNRQLQGLRSDLRSLPQPTSSDIDVAVYNEIVVNMDTEGIINAIEEMECGVVEEIQILGSIVHSGFNFVGDKLNIVSDQLDDGFNLVSDKLNIVSDQLDDGFNFVGNKLDIVGDKLESIDGKLNNISWTMTRLVGVAEEVAGYMRSLEQVTREPLANTARQHSEQGLVWFYEGELELAKPSLLKALESDTTNFLARYHLGFIYLIEEEYSSSWRAFELAAKCARNNNLRRAEAFICAVRAAHLDENPEQFSQFLERAKSACLGDDKREAPVWLEYIIFSQLGGNEAHAFDAARQLLALDDGYVYLVEALGIKLDNNTLQPFGWMRCPQCGKPLHRPSENTPSDCRYCNHTFTICDILGKHSWKLIPHQGWACSRCESTKDADCVKTGKHKWKRKPEKRSGYHCKECPVTKEFCDHGQHNWKLKPQKRGGYNCTECPATKEFCDDGQHNWKRKPGKQYGYYCGKCPAIKDADCVANGQHKWIHAIKGCGHECSECLATKDPVDVDHTWKIVPHKGYKCANCAATKDADCAINGKHKWVGRNYRWECTECPTTKPCVCTNGHQWYQTIKGSFFTRSEYTCAACGKTTDSSIKVAFTGSRAKPIGG